MPQSATDLFVEDINQDAIDDIFVICVDKKDNHAKSLSVFISKEDGTHPEKPTFSLALDVKTGALFFAEVDGQAPKELVAVYATGAHIYTYGDAKFTLSSQSTFYSLLPTGAQEPLFLKDSVHDLDGDGIDEWILPHPDGYLLQHGDATLATLNCDVRSEYRRGENLYIYNRLPSFAVFELPDSKIKGLAFLSDEYADFSYGENWAQHKRFKIPRDLDEKWEASAKMADINDDGFPDLAITQTKGTVNLESYSQIYIATAPFEYPEKANAEFRSKGSISAPILRDIDGDETLDAVVFNVAFGLKNIMNFFLRSKVSVDIGIHSYANGTISAKPTQSTSLTLAAPEGRELIAYTLGDFNQDKRLDLAFTSTPNEFAIHLGDPDTFLASSPFIKFEIPAFGVALTGKLDQNDSDDIVFIHPGGENSKRIDLLVF